ncbi:MAG: DUF2029 domain-containing protein [Candidatus Lindowbacteria bacterium]|nr:DUF2029 domain-containing protein [Candidatus Lindowbacteria bacterium]
MFNKKEHRQMRLVMFLVYMSFAFAFRITMAGPAPRDTHLPDLSGDFMMNYDIAADILGAQSIINGSFDVYTKNYFPKEVPPDGCPIPYPPFSFYLQAPIVWAGLSMGLEPQGFASYGICGLLYVVLSGLCALQAGRVLKKGLGVSDETTVTVTVFLLLFSSVMFWVATYTARFDFVVALCLLLAMSSLAADKYGWAGFFIGLGMMTKQTVFPAAIVFMAVLLVGLLRKEIPFNKALRMVAGIPVSFVMLIPFLVVSPRRMWDGLFGTLQIEPIQRPSFVYLVLQLGKTIFPEEPLRQFLTSYSNWIILIACICFVFVVAAKRNVKFGSSQFCALVAVASFSIPVLAKLPSIERYTATPSVFMLLWAASRKPGFPYDALWFIILQGFILDHVPMIWKHHVGLVFYAVVCIYVYFAAFSEAASGALAGKLDQTKRSEASV